MMNIVCIHPCTRVIWTLCAFIHVPGLYFPVVLPNTQIPYAIVEFGLLLYLTNSFATLFILPILLAYFTADFYYFGSCWVLAVGWNCIVFYCFYFILFILMCCFSGHKLSCFSKLSCFIELELLLWVSFWIYYKQLLSVSCDDSAKGQCF